MNEKIRYKIVIAEDELPILENLVQKLESLDSPLEIVGKASNGEDALALLSEHHPHILFTDIRMPVMDGLELIRRAKEQFPLLHVVIISGYDEFEYAQKAIRCGVSDYLLKPVNAARLRETAQKLCEALRRTYAVSEREILASGLSGHLFLDELPFTLASNSFYMYLLCVGNLLDNCRGGADIEKINGLWRKLNPPQILSELLGNEPLWWLVDEKQPNCKMLITTVPQPGLCEAMHAPLTGEASFTVCSAAPVPFAKIWATAQMLRTLLHKRLKPCLSCCFEEACDEADPPCAVPDELLSAVAIHCKKGRMEAAAQGILQLLNELEKLHVPQLILEQQLFLLVSCLLESAGSNASESADAMEQIYEIIADSAEEGDMYSSLFTFLNELLLTLFLSSDSSEELYGRLKQHIDKNYLSPITIETIAEAFHFSPSYISRIFKKYNGNPPFKYLLFLRIEEAKRLIAAPGSLNFRLISEMVGYPDAHYFSRLFRNATGLSPSEYKKSLEQI